MISYLKIGHWKLFVLTVVFNFYSLNLLAEKICPRSQTSESNKVYLSKHSISLPADCFAYDKIDSDRAAKYARLLMKSEYPLEYISDIVQTRILPYYYWDQKILSASKEVESRVNLFVKSNGPLLGSSIKSTRLPSSIELSFNMAPSFLGMLYNKAANVHGNAFQVDSCHILTAAHVVMSGTEYFYQAANQDTRVSAKLLAYGDIDSRYYGDYVRIQRDWAVLTLQVENNLKDVISLSPSFFVQNRKVNSVGVRSDGSIVKENNCLVLAKDIGGSIKASCYGQPGLSGSPLYIENGSSKQIIGILSWTFNNQFLKDEILGAGDFVSLNGETNIFGENPLREIKKILLENPCKNLKN